MDRGKYAWSGFTKPSDETRVEWCETKTQPRETFLLYLMSSCRRRHSRQGNFSADTAIGLRAKFRETEAMYEVNVKAIIIIKWRNYITLPTIYPFKMFT